MKMDFGWSQLRNAFYLVYLYTVVETSAIGAALFGVVWMTRLIWVLIRGQKDAKTMCCSDPHCLFFFCFAFTFQIGCELN